MQGAAYTARFVPAENLHFAEFEKKRPGQFSGKLYNNKMRKIERRVLIKVKSPWANIHYDYYCNTIVSYAVGLSVWECAGRMLYYPAADSVQVEVALHGDNPFSFLRSFHHYLSA